MERLIIAFSSDKTRDMVKNALESGGMVVRACVQTGAEVLRQIKFMGGGMVVCAYKLPDMTAAQLCEDLEGAAFVLALGTCQQLADMEGEHAFTLPTPFSRGELLAAVRMLRQMEEKQLLYLLPERKREETLLIEQAKRILMRTGKLSEPAAHRKLQQLSMQRGLKTALVAKQIVEDETDGSGGTM